MARSTVRMDGQELRKLKEKIMLFGDPSKVDQFFESCAKELAARLLAKVIRRTPVGDYSGNDYVNVNGQHIKGHYVAGKMGGTLRRGWTATKDIRVQKVGSDYVVEIINPVEYASYVEFGHRTRSHTGWVEGQFMLTVSEKEIQNTAPQILEKKLEKWLKECFTS